ncbi:MAG: transposase [Acidimicrobiia bacterium]
MRQVHTASRGTYGANRVHAELTMGHGITVGHNAVAILMQRAGLAGLPGAHRCRRLVTTAKTVADLVDFDFVR